MSTVQVKTQDLKDGMSIIKNNPRTSLESSLVQGTQSRRSLEYLHCHPALPQKAK
jgi:hypothetical protein